MGRHRLKFVHSFRDRHGVIRHYYRRNGRRIVLPGLFGSPEFKAAYDEANSSQQPLNPAERRTVRGKSFDALALAYYASPKFANLSASSKTNYRRVIESFLVDHGQRRVDQMKREHVDSIVGKMSDKPGAGIVLLKRIRSLVRYAIQMGWRETDPTLGAESYKSAEIHTWSENEIATFEKEWPQGTRQRVGFDLLLYTGQRVSDARDMAVPDARNKIKVVQQKTGTALSLTAHPNLIASFKALPSGHLAALVTAYGKPYTSKGFGNMIGEAIRAAGLPERCVPHGLRKAAARRLAEAGCTPHEIMAVTGHKTLAEVERYTRAVEQERMNEAAMARQLASERNVDIGLANLPFRTGNPIEIK